MGGKFKFSDQGSDLAPFVGNGTKIKIPSEIKPPLMLVLNQFRVLTMTLFFDLQKALDSKGSSIISTKFVQLFLKAQWSNTDSLQWL